MSLFAKSKNAPSIPRPTIPGQPPPFQPIRTEDFKPEPGAKYQWLVIEPDILPGDDILVVLDPTCLADAQKENPGLVTYTLAEINTLIPHEHDIEFRKKIHMAKKTFGGWVRPANEPEALRV